MRKREIFIVTDEGRDKGKVFVLNEMSASQGEKWATRALLALCRSGIDLPESAAGSGLAGIAMLGLKSLSSLRFEEAEPLMDEMFKCVHFQPDPKRPDVVRPLIEDDIEEIQTRMKLRLAILDLHVGFSLADALSQSVSS